MIRSHSRRTYGFSLVELAIVLSVASVILSGVWTAASYGWEYYREQTAAQEIATVVGNVRNAYVAQVNIPGITYAAMTAGLVNTQAIPPVMKRATACSGNACADNPWGMTDTGGGIDATGTFRVCAWNAGSSTKCATTASPRAYFAIELAGLSQASCIAVARAVSGPSGPPGLVDLIINTHDLYGLNKAYQPIGLTDATNYCQVTSGTTPTLDFVYALMPPRSAGQ